MDASRLQSGAPVRVAVMGAGAVGAYFGALLARAGHAVTFIGRPAHVAAIRRDGVVLETAAGATRIPAEATGGAAGVAGAQVVLFCVKSTDTAAAAEQIAEHLEDDAVVLSLQNGVDNVERMRAQLAQPVVPAVVYVATAMSGPGHVRHFGRGDLVIGAGGDARGLPLLAPLKALFEAAGVPVKVSDDVVAEAWAKLITNCAYNAISALSQLPYGRMIASAGIPDVMRDVIDESRAVAAADGVCLPDGLTESVLRLAAAMPAQLSSTAQDLARGKPTEIDHLNGFVTRRGAERGVPTPVNRTLHALVKLAESRSD